MLRAFSRVLRNKSLVLPGERVLVAVSGGADSVALLHLFHAVAPEFSCALSAAHLDHAIRPESAGEAEFVARICASLGVPLHTERIDVPALARARRQGLEEAAREARREFLGKVAKREGCTRIALGHHRGDQAETVLHRLLRGSALSGLAAMRPASGLFIRPLLPFARQRLLDFLAARDIPFVEDASNRDTAFTRNRIRHRLLPLLSTFNPRIEEHLGRFSERLAIEEDYWEREERRLLSDLGEVYAEEIRLDRVGLLSLHPAARSRVLRRALLVVRGDLQGLAACHIEALDGLLRGARPQAEVVLPRAWAGRRYEDLWLRRMPPDLPPPVSILVAGPGNYPLPGGGELQVELLAAPKGEEGGAVEFDSAQVSFPLRVRSPRPGDRFRPEGLGGGKKLKDFLIDAKVPRERRRSLLLVEEEEVLWIVGMRRCAGRRPCREGGGVLRLSAKLPVSPTIQLVKSEGL